MTFVFRFVLSLLAVTVLCVGSSSSLPLGVGVGGGLLAPAGDFGQDLRGAFSLSLGFGLFPIEKLKLGFEVSYASLRGKGDTDLTLELLGGEIFGRYILRSFTDDVRLYGLVGAGNSRLIRKLGSGEERGYQASGVLGGGGVFRVYERANVDAGLRFRKYFSKKTGDAFLLQLGIWYGL
jgi:hypothetical protein